jgi:hypothetical protein
MSAMMRARLIAFESPRWCFVHTPERLRGTIFAKEEMYRRNVSTSL